MEDLRTALINRKRKDYEKQEPRMVEKQEWTDSMDGEGASQQEIEQALSELRKSKDPDSYQSPDSYLPEKKKRGS